MGLITPAIRESCNPVAALRSIRASLAVTLSTEGFSDSDPLSFLEQQGMPLDLARARAASALSEIRVLTRNLVVHRYTTDGALGPFVTRELIPQATARKQRLALPPWNDGAVHTSHVLPAGAVVCVGRATASFGQPGGGTQLYVPSLETHPDRIKYRELEAFIAA